MIQAKPIVADRYWILKQDNRKVGEIEATGEGYTVKLANQVRGYKTIKLVSREANIEFEKPETASPAPKNLVHGFPAVGHVYNPVWDVRHRLPLYTREDKSKSWYAAGWYLIKQHRTWKLVQAPKLITLQRYPYQGPFRTKGETNEFAV